MVCRRSTKTKRRIKLRQLLFEIDDRCHICGRRLVLKKNHPNRATLDHMIRQRDGGTDDIENLKLAHGKCNVERN